MSARAGSVTRSAASTPSALAIRFSQPTETVRVPVSSRPIVCGSSAAASGDVVERHLQRA